MLKRKVKNFLEKMTSNRKKIIIILATALAILILLFHTIANFSWNIFGPMRIITFLLFGTAFAVIGGICFQELKE